MNTNDLSKYSTISGKTKSYQPDGIAYFDTVITEDLENVIIICCYFGQLKDRFFDEVKFYNKITPENFKGLQKSPLMYILYSCEEDSQDIIKDLKESTRFKQ